MTFPPWVFGRFCLELLESRFRLLSSFPRQFCFNTLHLGVYFQAIFSRVICVSCVYLWQFFPPPQRRTWAWMSRCESTKSPMSHLESYESRSFVTRVTDLTFTEMPGHFESPWVTVVVTLKAVLPARTSVHMSGLSDQYQTRNQARLPGSAKGWTLAR